MQAYAAQQELPAHIFPAFLPTFVPIPDVLQKGLLKNSAPFRESLHHSPNEAELKYFLNRIGKYTSPINQYRTRSKIILKTAALYT